MMYYSIKYSLLLTHVSYLQLLYYIYLYTGLKYKNVNVIIKYKLIIEV